MEEKLADIELTDIFNDKTLADMIEAIDLDAEEEYEEGVGGEVKEGLVGSGLCNYFEMMRLLIINVLL